MALNSPLVDAWCVCTIDEKRMVVGLQMPVAKLKHPRAEVVAKEHFNAIHCAFGTHGVSVHKAAWVVSVLPAAHYVKFPYQHAKADVWGIWPHTQAKLAMPLDEQGLVVLLSPCAESAPPCTAAEASPLTARESRCWPEETQTSCCCPGARARQPPPTRAHSGRIDGCIPHTNTAGSWAPSGGRMRAMRWPASAGAGLTRSFTGT